MTNLNLKKYRLKTPVEAIQVSPENIKEVVEYLNWVNPAGEYFINGREYQYIDSKELYFKPAFDGDWIVIANGMFIKVMDGITFKRDYEEN